MFFFFYNLSYHKEINHSKPLQPFYIPGLSLTRILYSIKTIPSYNVGTSYSTYQFDRKFKAFVFPFLFLLSSIVCFIFGGIIRKELPQHSFTIVEASTPPTPSIAWSTEYPLPTSKHASRQE